jgi:hypothetical protein
MIPTSNPQSSALVPISRQSVDSGISLETRFNDSSKDIYSKFSVYDAGGHGFHVGFQQPYVWTGLNDSKTWKYLKKYDNTTFPEGSTVQDTLRVTKFIASGRGATFAGIQFLLQNQNSFNETRIWNPASILFGTAQKGLLGLIDRPNRHIESSGGGIFSTILDGFLTTVGIKTKAILGKTAPSGTAKMGLEALSLEAKTGGGWASKGLSRYESAVSGRDRFIAKFSSDGKNLKGQSVVSNFLSSIGKSIISKVTSKLPTTKGNTANWDYRVEYSDTIKVFDAFRADRSGLLKSKVAGAQYEVVDIHRYYPTEDKTTWYFGPEKQGKNPPPSTLEGLASQLASQKYDPTVNVDGKKLGNPPTVSGLVTKKVVDDVIGEATVNRLNGAMAKWNSNTSYDKITDINFFKGGAKTYKEVSGVNSTIPSYRNSIINTGGLIDFAGGKDFAASNKADGYNQLRPIYSVDGIPDELLDKSKGNSKDTIFFYFYDLVNNVYIPFRATVSGLNENNSVEWEDFQYIGRADKLYMYKGFTREINFTFSVYANSISEMEPMWARINYLSGLTRPANYTSDASGFSEFIYPPMVTFRLGDLYIDQPSVIRSFGFSIPDDAVWETSRTVGAKYSYKNGAISSTKNAAQLPMKVDVTIAMALLEKERSQTKSLRYFDKTLPGFSNPNEVSSQRDINKKEKNLKNMAYVNSAFKSNSPAPTPAPNSSFGTFQSIPTFGPGGG